MPYRGKHERSKGNKSRARMSIIMLFFAAAVVVTSVAIKKRMNYLGAGAAYGSPSASGGAGTHGAHEAEVRADLIREAGNLKASYFYEEAIELLKGRPELENEEILGMISEIEALRDSLVKYEGSAGHVFFHSLIIYPELAFDNTGHPAEGYNMWMTTASEFKKMLPLLYEAGYVLYDIESLVTVNADGSVSPGDIMLPPGKKPLVISIDDVNYYNYMKPDGFADRLHVNDKGEVVTIVYAPDGTVSETYDGDVVPILDRFVEEHPDFSYRGAKGIVATTGYEGAFGYRITDDLPEEELNKLREEVTKVAEALLTGGWRIACHSYTHNSYFQDGSVTIEQMKYDLDKWNRLIRPYIVESNIYISAFGMNLSADDARYRYIMDNGFHIYCPVGADMSTSFRSDSMYQSRLNLDGFTMIKYPERISRYFFDPALVLDPERPKMS